MQVVAAIISNSYSVISTVIDSAVDITSGGVIWLTLRAIERSNPYEYPRGMHRIEPVAVVIVAIVMGVANLVMIIMSGASIVSGTVQIVIDFSYLVLYMEVPYLS